MLEQVMDDMLALKEKCVKPDTKAPYIKSVKGGKDKSIEGLQVSTTGASWTFT